jgi:hypothetical protein
LLATHSDWLLIADNVEELELLQTVLPSRREGALLLTTRHQALGPLAEALEVPPLSREEGFCLLLARAKLLWGMAPPHTVPPETPITTGATELVTLLEGLPLAVDQAGNGLSGDGLPLALSEPAQIHLSSSGHVMGSAPRFGQHHLTPLD